MPHFQAQLPTLSPTLFSDILPICIFVIVAILIGVLFGRWKSIALLFSIYVGLALLPELGQFKPLIAQFPQIARFDTNLLLFIVALCISFFFLTASVFRGWNRQNVLWWQPFVLSFIASGLLLCIMVRFESVKNLLPLTGISKTFFATPTAYITWLLLPLPGFLLARKRFE